MMIFTCRRLSPWQKQIYLKNVLSKQNLFGTFFCALKGRLFILEKNIIENVSKVLIKRMRCTTINLSAEAEMLQGKNI